MHRLLLLFALLCAFAARVQAQEATVTGTVTNEDGSAAALTSVAVLGERSSVQADEEGNYTLLVPAGRPIVLRFSQAGNSTDRNIELVAGERRTINVTLKTGELPVAEVQNTRDRGNLEALDPRVVALMPNPTGDVMSLVKGGLGVMSRNELSSGYSVRGGNYDENLVYVNDIEVYRPFLVRAGQQEGLSFPNADLIQGIRFSPGGFDARFGDKMSSVLDITYKRPREFEGSFSAGLMGGSFSLASPMLNKRLRQITGFRYRTLQNLLAGLDTKGEYDARYVDLQTYWTYDLSDKVELGFLGVYSRNRYDQVPQDRETELGNFNQALRFKVFFEGQERTAYETYFGALNLNVRANRDLLLKFTFSGYRTFESERYDILGQYFLQELDRDLGSDQFGEAVRNLGVGSYLDHGRNDLDATVLTAAHKGFLQLPGSYLQWGADVKSEVINDKLSEWTLIDSAGYSTPTSTGEALELNYSLKSRIDLRSIRTSGYVQNAWDWKLDTLQRNGRTLGLTAGVRAQYWTYNGQTIVSPRARLIYRPGGSRVKKDGTLEDRDHTYWFATGVYDQAPFYRELRDFDGVLNPTLRAQRSIHLILGTDRMLDLWGRPFKWTTEAYYKFLSDLVPYEVDNVRIRYYARNNSSGYAFGVDTKLNGELIPGIESWVGVSVMSTQEDLNDDFYYIRLNAAGDTIVPGYTFDQVPVDSILKLPGYIPRPTDQRVSVNLYFQDEMPRWPTFKVHMNLVFGTGLPFGPPSETRYADTLRTSLYRRVDIGFSKQFLGATGQEQTNFLRHIKSMYLTLEVFNLLNINNTVDYTWIEDVDGRSYAIPDFLTPRRLNLKLVATF
jgi:hypothetical protein